MNYSEHKREWANCLRCELGEKCHKVVLARGMIPADILVVGEAPGDSENVIGQPFVGPAGKLLERQIAAALQEVTKTLRLCYTNVIGCIPTGEDGNKLNEPPDFAIQACRPRVLEMLKLVKPQLIVSAGLVATKQIPGLLEATYLKSQRKPAHVSIMHPAAILRMDVSRQGLEYQRVVVTLTEAFTQL